MRNVISILGVVTVLLAFTSCRDKATERRIAALESRVSALESSKAPGAPEITATPTAAGVQPQPQTPVQAVPEGPVAAMAFETTNHDFGTIKEGDEVEYTYKFKNTGAAPLVIEQAQGSCGCTVPDWTKGTIPVGGTGYVKAKFNSNGKKGFQNKTVTVTANTSPKQTQLSFVANVLPKNGTAAQ